MRRVHILERVKLILGLRLQIYRVMIFLILLIVRLQFLRTNIVANKVFKTSNNVLNPENQQDHASSRIQLWSEEPDILSIISNFQVVLGEEIIQK